MRAAPEITTCPNCGTGVVGKFCPECGQRIADVKIGVKPLFADLLEDQFNLGAALPRTLTTLFFHPGRLTNEYLSLHIARYLAPFRIYLVSSVIFFLLLSFVTKRQLRDVTGIDQAVDSVAVSRAVQKADSARRAKQLRDSSAAKNVASAVKASMPVATAAPASANTKRCSRFGSGSARERTQPGAPPDQVHNMSLGVTGPDSSLVLGLRTDASKPHWAEEAQVDLGSERLARAVCQRLLVMESLPPDVAVRRLVTGAISNTPKIMFLLLPLFALLLKILYTRRKRYYVEHFVFSLHVHAFVFMLFTLLLLLHGWSILTTLVICWMPVYVLLAMKRVYGQGWLKTLTKWFVLGCVYMTILTFAALTVFVSAIFTV